MYKNTLQKKSRSARKDRKQSIAKVVSYSQQNNVIQRSKWFKKKKKNEKADISRFGFDDHDSEDEDAYIEVLAPVEYLEEEPKPKDKAKIPPEYESHGEFDTDYRVARGVEPDYEANPDILPRIGQQGLTNCAENVPIHSDLELTRSKLFNQMNIAGKAKDYKSNIQDKMPEDFGLDAYPLDNIPEDSVSSDFSKSHPWDKDILHSNYLCPMPLEGRYLNYVRHYIRRAGPMAKDYGITCSEAFLAADEVIESYFDQLCVTAYRKSIELMRAHPLTNPMKFYYPVLDEVKEQNDRMGSWLNGHYVRGCTHRGYQEAKEEIRKEKHAERKARGIEQKVEASPSLNKFDREDPEFLNLVIEYDPDTVDESYIADHWQAEAAVFVPSFKNIYTQIYEEVLLKAWNQKYYQMSYVDALSQLMFDIDTCRVTKHPNIFNEKIVRGLALRIIFELYENKMFQ
ncbi:hypothetical protein [Aureibacter tunicatorum]|uniref:Uncharacterized protein n=1 Tax=Aureibacter tunicatorum TaxID=866807 RepID=A0AAE4BT66_9BACT|nr:hypothetical protein [Aureibacter tunicatorum]MDR6239217.1 hypothetical protein [Aureibacter tunicatorum]BDD04858.1 hypothetical protein AUTU_23410 [Aureibacter tunicatorum]